MSQPAFKALDLPFELVYSDGEPLETPWHRVQMNLLLDLIDQLMGERARSDFYSGGDEFVYYSVEQARDVASGRPYFRGPDVYFVDHVDPRGDRKAWVSWEEGGRLPDLILELLSPSTEHIDRTVKKDLYAHTFRTRDYFLYDFDTGILEGFHLVGGTYQPIQPDSRGRLRSDVLGADLGLWHGRLGRFEKNWVRLYQPDGRMIPSLAEAERQRAEAERQRAEAAEAETARLRALLADRDGDAGT
jgi:Uma2 family endonuclease